MANFLDNIDMGKLSAYLSGAGKASASANQAEGQYYNARDAIKAGLYGSQVNAANVANAQGLNNAKFSTSLPGQGASEAVRGSMIQNMQDATADYGDSHATRMSFSGGTRPSNLTPEARQAGADLIKHGQSLIANPGSFVPTQQSVAPPALSPEPKAGFWGQAAGVGGTITGLLNALGKGDKSGGNVPLNKIIDWLSGKGRSPFDPNDYGMDPNLWGGGPDDGGGDDGYGYDPNQDRGPFDGSDPLTGGSASAGGVPLPGGGDDGEGYYDDNGNYVQGYPTNDADGAGGETTGTNWWDE